MAAVRNVWPLASHHVCFFHFCQAVFREVQHLGLVRDYMANVEVRTIVPTLMSTALLPLAEVPAAVNAIEVIVAMQYHVLAPLLEYFRNQWMNRVAPHYWNVHNRPRRTNNDVEAWHNSTKKSIALAKPDVYCYIDWLRHEE